MAKYLLLGDSCVIIRFGTSIEEDINRKVQIFASLIEKKKIKGVKEMVPAYTELAVYYDPSEIKFNDLIKKLKKTEKLIKPGYQYSYTIVHIPVCYGGKFGADLNYVAKYNDLNIDEVIKIHSKPLYLVYMLGFTPGFCYLGGLSSKIATPRKKNPDLKVPGGMVGIAGEQTGIYPIESPGGWQAIGRTPVKFFDPLRKKSVLVEAGNYITFVPISESEFLSIQNEIDQGTYKLKRTEKHV